MFWSKKKKLPITQQDKEWTEEALLFIKDSFGEDCFNSINTILPTKEYYNINFKGNEEDAVFILEQTKIYMDFEDFEVSLDFFSDNPVHLDDGTLLSSPADINGKWKSNPSMFEETSDGKAKIYVERDELKNVTSLIATISYELSNFIPLGEGRIEDHDEYLNDLIAITYGFGIFLGNSCFNHTIISSGLDTGWKMSRTGYLPEQIIAYAMAWLSVYRNEDTQWKKFLNPTMLKHFETSIEYIENNKQEIRFQ